VTAFYAQKFSSDIQTTISFTTFVKDFFYENKWVILILASLSMFYNRNKTYLRECFLTNYSFCRKINFWKQNL